MRQTTITFSRIIFIAFLGLILIACQREDPAVFNQDIDPVKHEVEATDTQYLYDLIVTIEGMVTDGTLNAGNGNALISKINNAINSIEKGNTNAVSGQLGSFINSTEALVNSGTLTEEIAEILIEPAEEGILLADGIFVDPRDEEEYFVVQIGEQIWMAENLRATIYNDGTDIPLITNGSTWPGTTTPAYCWYNNDESIYGTVYGALYNWYTVETGNLCPVGWHVPSDAEFITLYSNFGGKSVAGGKLKDDGTLEEGTGLWLYNEIDPTTVGTNESGFTALPGGHRRDINGNFRAIGTLGHWWSVNLYSSIHANYITLYHDRIDLFHNHVDKRHGLSVRCLKD